MHMDIHDHPVHPGVRSGSLIRGNCGVLGGVCVRLRGWGAQLDLVTPAWKAGRTGGVPASCCLHKTECAGREPWGCVHGGAGLSETHTICTRGPGTCRGPAPSLFSLHSSFRCKSLPAFLSARGPVAQPAPLQRISPQSS